jgi:hypothetical protein
MPLLPLPSSKLSSSQVLLALAKLVRADYCCLVPLLMLGQTSTHCMAYLGGGQAAAAYAPGGCEEMAEVLCLYTSAMEAG